MIRKEISFLVEKTEFSQFEIHPEIPSRKLIPAINSDLHLCSLE